MKDYQEMESSQRQYQNIQEHTQKMENGYEFHALKIANELCGVPKKDGNEWCFLWGENIQEGICGFGETIICACIDFYENLSKLKEEIK